MSKNIILDAVKNGKRSAAIELLKKLNFRNYDEAEFTPKTAQEILEKLNTKNRRCDPAEVKKYVREIENGNFHPRSAPIQFIYEPRDSDFHGILNNGQHRLTAISESGKRVWVKVDPLISKKDAEYVDRGRKRNEGQTAQMFSDPEYNPSHTVIINQVYNLYKSLGRARYLRSGASSGAGILMQQDRINFAQKYREYIEESREASCTDHQNKIILFAFYVLTKIFSSQESHEKFWENYLKFKFNPKDENYEYFKQIKNKSDKFTANDRSKDHSTAWYLLHFWNSMQGDLNINPELIPVPIGFHNKKIDSFFLKK